MAEIEKTAVTDKPWDGSRARFTLEQLMRAVPAAVRAWAKNRAAANDRDVIKEDLKLPYKEPNGTINLNAVRNALAVIGGARGGVDLPRDVVASARQELESVLGEYSPARKGDPFGWWDVNDGIDDRSGEENMIKLEPNAVVWKSSGPANDCCFGMMDEIVPAGRNRECWCGNKIRAVDGLMEKEFAGDLSDFSSRDVIAEKSLKLLYFRKAHFLSAGTIRKWYEARRIQDICSLLRVGHEGKPDIEIGKAVETKDAWIVRLEGGHEPVNPVFARIDTGVVGLFDD